MDYSLVDLHDEWQIIMRNNNSLHLSNIIHVTHSLYALQAQTGFLVQKNSK
jgi:hypothetical protein